MAKRPDPQETRQDRTSADRPGSRVVIPRREPRLRTHLREGRICTVTNQVVSECLFIDMSSHGARLRLPVQIPLPTRLIVFDGRSQATFVADLRWQRQNEIGVFIREGTLDITR